MAFHNRLSSITATYRFRMRERFGVVPECVSLEDEQCAQAAGVNFMWADVWRQRFTPGIYEFKAVNVEQVRFLEA